MIRMLDYRFRCFAEECAKILMHKFDLSAKDQIRFWVFSPDGTLDLPDEDATRSLSSLDLTIKHVSDA